MAVAVADGARTISEVRCRPIRPHCSGRWRRTRRAGGCWTGSTRPWLGAVARARVAAREVGVGPARRTHGAAVPVRTCRRTRVAGPDDRLDAAVVVCHSEKEQAAPTFKKTLRLSPDAGVLRQHR